MRGQWGLLLLLFFFIVLSPTPLYKPWAVPSWVTRGVTTGMPLNPTGTPAEGGIHHVWHIKGVPREEADLEMHCCWGGEEEVWQWYLIGQRKKMGGVHLSVGSIFSSPLLHPFVCLLNFLDPTNPKKLEQRHPWRSGAGRLRNFIFSVKVS
jgi:hypothetical protein